MSRTESLDASIADGELLANEAKQDLMITKLENLAGFTFPSYDYIGLTYVTVGNGIGEIETITYKTGGAGGTIVALFTLTYDANDELSTVTKT